MAAEGQDWLAERATHRRRAARCLAARQAKDVTERISLAATVMAAEAASWLAEQAAHRRRAIRCLAAAPAARADRPVRICWLPQAADLPRNRRPTAQVMEADGTAGPEQAAKGMARTVVTEAGRELAGQAPEAPAAAGGWREKNWQKALHECVLAEAERQAAPPETAQATRSAAGKTAPEWPAEAWLPARPLEQA